MDEFKEEIEELLKEGVLMEDIVYSEDGYPYACESDLWAADTYQELVDEREEI